MAERRWRIHRRGRGLFEIAVDDGDGFRPATTAEVDTALRQRELFGAADEQKDPAAAGRTTPGAAEISMRFDQRTPCENCPFRKDGKRITFRTRERAEEIEEQAYRHGFPCHVSAEVEENPVTGKEGFVFGERTQHCAGYILMQLREGSGSAWPGIGNDEELLSRLAKRMDWRAPVFDTTDEFLDANGEPDDDEDEDADE